MCYIIYIPFCITNQKLEKNILFKKLSNRQIVSLFFKIWKIRDSSSVANHFYVISCKDIGYNLKIEPRRAILVDPYFASKSPGHDATLTSFASNLWEVRNLYLRIGYKINSQKGTATFALIAPLVWQISRKTGEGGLKKPRNDSLPQWSAE